jgi:4-hydroxy-2-oxoglutarate aldolase
MRALHGIFAPVVTPFQAGTEDLDLDGFRANCRAHLADGLAGLVVAGSTGEAALLDEGERAALVAAAREVAPADRLVIAGTGAESTRQCLVRCRAARDAGADAVLVVAPHYYANAMTLEALRAHYQRVAEASPLPVILYNIPKYMHFALPAELVAELAVHPNVVGIKDSSGDAAMLAGFLAAQSETFTVLTGSGAGLHGALQAGGAHAAGDATAAAAGQAILTPLAQVIVAKLGVPGVKYAMERVGRVGGAPRLPLLPLDAVGRAEVDALLPA